MKKTYEEIIGELDEAQRGAARITGNAVIAAGAGSGKTRVLAARFLHLVIEREIPVDEILTLTFTRKAASEMYGRIYATLRDTDHPLARDAVNDFHLARIDTIDAFCNSVARNACRDWGIAPDFSVDSDRASRMANELALSFFLEKRRSPAIRQLMKRYSLAELPQRLFADTALRHFAVSSPLDFAGMSERQSAEIRKQFSATSAEITGLLSRFRDLSGGKSKTAAQIAEAIKDVPEVPEEIETVLFGPFIDRCGRIASVALPGNAKDPDLAELKEVLFSFKKKTFPEFLSVANFILNRPFLEETFSLLSEFQDRFNAKKRAGGILTFPDVSRLALDALIEDPDLRRAWKKSTSAIMIDEFQDDNAMQRDLLFLLAEKPERMDRSVPSPDELCPDKLFFVGDEKQSIYRFRGADVSVFRALARDLSPLSADSAGPGRPALDVNYRTETALIDSFNALFPSIFANASLYPGKELPLYEASFSDIRASRKTEGLEPSLEILLVDEKAFPENDPRLLSPAETEAAEVARIVSDLLSSGYPVRDEGGTRACRSDDIAILFRSGTRQHLYERFLREAGIPSQSETLRGLFADAPINDLHALLRLAVYPDDDTAYAIVLRSPFSGVGDRAFTATMLERVTAKEEGNPPPPPFSAADRARFSARDEKAFARGKELFGLVRSMADRFPAAEIITRLWYAEGYRYSLLRDPDLHRYLELYDYFFELARQADARGETLATFLDRIQDLMTSGEKIEGLDIPAGRSGGVRLMTVHKSKGLEFPVVFLVDAGNEGRGTRNDDPVFFSQDAGLSVNTGGADEAEKAKANWFYERGREEERQWEQAELRRLLYVAMTRAETRLFITGTFSGESGSNAEAGAKTGDEIRASIAASLERKEKSAALSASKDDLAIARSFLDLLFPALASGPLAGITIRDIPPAARTGRRSRDTGFEPEKTRSREEIETFYGLTPLAEYEPSPRTKYGATALQPAEPADERGNEREKSVREPDALDALLKKTGIGPSDFGTFAHRAIESRFTGLSPAIPSEIADETDRMANRFLASPLGQKAKEALWRKNEYGFITRYEHEGKNVTVTGQMDLIFEHEGTVYVVDYKTDREEHPETHAIQLSVYRKAAADLTGKPVESWLFYLRTGHSIKV